MISSRVRSLAFVVRERCHTASPSLTFNASSFIRHQPQLRQLLSAAVVGRVTSSTQSLPNTGTTPQTPAQNQVSQPTSTPNDLFLLDFHAPSAPKLTSAPPPPVKDIKQDILPPRRGLRPLLHRCPTGCARFWDLTAAAATYQHGGCQRC